MRSGLTFLLAAVMIASSLMMAQSRARGSDDVLLDDGFEGGVSGWAATGGDLAASSAAHEGSGAAVFTSTSVGAGTGILQHAPVPIRPDGDYSLSAYFLLDDPRVESITLTISWKDGNGDPTGRSLQARLTSQDALWQIVTLNDRAPQNAASALVRVMIVSESGGAVYVDDVRLEGPPPLPPTPTATDGPQAPATATAVIASATPTRAPSPTPTSLPTLTPTPHVFTSLVNGDFETGEDDVLAAWSKYGGELYQSPSYYHGGRHSGALRSTSDSTKWAFQSLTVSPGAAYQFDAYVLVDDPNAREAFLRISWYESGDATGSAIGVSDSTTHLAGSDPSFRLLTTGAALAPATAASARFRIVLGPASSAPATIYMDDASVQQVAPEFAATPAPPPALEEGLENEEQIPADTSAVARRRSDEGAAGVDLQQDESPYTLKINEVSYDPPQPGDEAGWEWLELYNPSQQPIDLTGWTLRDNDAGDSLPSLVLAPHGYVVIAAGNSFLNAYPDFSGSALIIPDGRIGNGLANSGDHVLLYDPAGKLADAVSWGDDSAAFVPPVASVVGGHSIERSPPGHDTDAAADFVDNDHPSPGKAIGTSAVAGAAVERQAETSSVMSPPETSASQDSESVMPRLTASFSAGIIALLAGLRGAPSPTASYTDK